MLANNSSGAHSVKYGDTRRHTLGLEVVTADGSVARTGELGDDLIEELLDAVEGREDLMEEHFPDVSKNSSGYHLPSLVETGDATGALVGSEGTLGVFTKARLNLEPVPSDRVAALLHFASLDDAGEAVPKLLSHGPSAVELVDATFIELVRDEKSGAGAAFPPDTEASLLVEFDGGDAEAIASEALNSVSHLYTDRSSATDKEEREELWRVRTAGLPLLYNLEEGRRVTPFVEDVVVPPKHLLRYVKDLRSILERHGVDAAIYGHAGEGNIHTRPFLDLEDPGDREKMRSIADEVFELVAELGGTISGEHGDGYLRTGHLETVYGPLTQVFRDVKEALDPAGVMNPGKVVGPDRMTENLRAFTVKPSDAAAQAAEACHGCGACRSRTGRTCPYFHAEGKEAATPRAKANLARAVARDELDREMAADYAGLCYGCRSCRVECLTSVDGAAVSALTREPSSLDRLLSSYGLLGKIGSKLPLQRLPVPGPVKDLLGIARNRELPRFEGNLSVGTPMRLDSGGEVTLYDVSGKVRSYDPGGGGEEDAVQLLPGCHAAHYDHGPAEALEKVLERCGYEVLRPETVCCGIPMLATGQRRRAKSFAEKNLGNLSPDLPVISTCPSCVLALREDYPGLLGLEHDLEVYEAFELLEKLREEARFVEPEGDVEGGYAHHEPCHSRLLDGSCAENFLESRTELVEVPDTCCGMGGTHGFRAESYDDSLETGSPIFRAAEDEGAVMATECPSCQLQFRHVLGDAVHPLELLAETYR